MKTKKSGYSYKVYTQSYIYTYVYLYMYMFILIYIYICRRKHTHHILLSLIIVCKGQTLEIQDFQRYPPVMICCNGLSYLLWHNRIFQNVAAQNDQPVICSWLCGWDILAGLCEEARLHSTTPGASSRMALMVRGWLGWLGLSLLVGLTGLAQPVLEDPGWSHSQMDAAVLTVIRVTQFSSTCPHSSFMDSFHSVIQPKLLYMVINF